MPDQLRISAKALGAMALGDFCPRCFWVQMRVHGKLPYQIFPGIFSSIDAYQKRVVHGWFDRHERPPKWLASLGHIKEYRKPPHHSNFYVSDPETSVYLSGSPDGVLVRANNSFVIVDYKTAKFTDTQDELFPMYEVQLNAYAYIGERCGLAPVSGLALIYTEPMTDETAANRDANMAGDGFLMKFNAHILPVEIKPEIVPTLMRRAREISDLERPPRPAEGCEDCARLQGLIAASST